MVAPRTKASHAQPCTDSSIPCGDRYFSKEKSSEEGFNLACILTLPPYQRRVRRGWEGWLGSCAGLVVPCLNEHISEQGVRLVEAPHREPFLQLP